MLFSQLALISLASAAVELDFRIGNSHDLQLNDKSVRQHLEHHQLHRRKDSKPSKEPKSKESKSNSTVEPAVNATLSSSYNFYYGDLLVGQPAQKIEVLLDTGSPVSWFYGPRGSYHNATRFFPNESLTFNELNETFSAEYGSGVYLGRWGADLVAAPQFVAKNTTYNVSANGTTGNSSQQFNQTWDLSNSTLINTTSLKQIESKKNSTLRPYSVPLEFGVISSFVSAAGAPGLLGLGPHIEGAGPKGYLSLPEAYAKYNVTSSPAFSVFLEEQTGRFLFGGADLQYADLPFFKYSPPKNGSGSHPTSWNVVVESVLFKDKGHKVNNISVNSSVVLDSGSPITLLPSKLVETIGKELKFKKNEEFQAFYTTEKASKIPKNATLTFVLSGGLEIKAPLHSFLVPGEYIWLDQGPKNVTALAILPSNSYLLGDGFFRNAYTVLDPSSGDVLISKRSKALLNSTSSKNASTVVPVDKLIKNPLNVIDVNEINELGKTNSSLGVEVTPPTTSPDVNYAGMAYIGTVAANKAASVSSAAASAASATGSAASKASSAASSVTGSSSKSSSSKSKNAAVSVGAPSGVIFILTALFSLI